MAPLSEVPMFRFQGCSGAVRPIAVAIAAAALLVSALTVDARAQQAIIVVRHAEKVDQSDDSGLSPAGLRRAKALAELLRGAGVTHIVATEYRRTQETAAPLAAALGLTVERLPARDFAALAAKLRGFEPDAIVLVVGHSNTIPPMLATLGWPNQLDIKEPEYDNAWVLVPHAGQRASIVRLKYGKRTS
jgi:broad specificity phosphatase PhoE